MWLSREELAAAVGISPAQLSRLIRLGLVEPAAPGPGESPVHDPVPPPYQDPPQKM